MNNLILELKQYLINRRYSFNTVESRLKDVNYFFNWLTFQNINYLEVSYADILSYVKFCKMRENKQATIKQKVKSIQFFYEFLESKSLIKQNPCIEIKLRGGIKRIPNNLLDWEELEELHNKIPTKNATGKRNKAILSLMIYQGLETGAISKLKLEDLKLEEGKIYIPKTARGNSRTLDLKANQMYHLQQYLTLVRPYLLSLKDQENEQLFFSNGAGKRLDSLLTNLVNHLKEINPKVTGIRQIRTSVITHWLSIHSLREVQYLAGHRYVSSTEYYRIDKLENLQEQIENLHPLN